MPQRPAILKYDLNPLDKMLVCHGMSRAPDSDSYSFGCLLDDWNMLFRSRVSRIFNKMLHWLTTADQFASASVDHLHHVSAFAAFIDFV
jgi:hypothetical protein